MKIHALWQDYPDLAVDLQATLTLMNKSITLSNKEVEAAIHTMIHAGGKLLRPAYLLLFAEFGKQQDREKMIALAAAMETLHTATLIHDDIVDEADLRRNRPTIQSQFGKDVAVYAGDYLFVCCFKILANYASSFKSIQLNANSMDRILAGELGQLDKRYDLTVSVKDYLNNISGKTAELFALSSFVGAYESGCSELFANRVRKIGQLIGVTFQIMDDILDYSQTADAIGKPVLEDVRQGVYSLPLLYALQENPQALIPLLNKKAAMTDADAQAVFELVQQSHGLSAAQELAQSYTTKALKEISKLPKNQHGTKDKLYTLTESLLQRSF